MLGGCVRLCYVLRCIRTIVLPTNIVAYANVSNDFINGVFRCGTALIYIFGFGHIYLAPSGLWTTFVVSLALLVCAKIVDRARPLCL